MTTTTYNNTQIMMTLSALAGTDATPLPFESLAHQEERILKGLNTVLANPGIATTNNWQAIWVGLSSDRANLSYIAKNTTANQYAVVFRGTDFAMAIDRKEDFDVGTAVPFTQVDSSVSISQGSMEAFTEIIGATYTDGTNLLTAVQNIVKSSSGTTLFVTGHSLGGAIASMLSLYLNSQISSGASFQIYTFAAPTAGLDNFAKLFDTTFPNNSWRVYNLWDVVPNAWQTLSNIDNFYPGGPLATDYIKKEVAKLQDSTNGLAYTQPTVNPVPLNQQELRDMKYINNTTADFIKQLAFQHNGNTYLTLLGAPNI
ncbi:MAG: lipase family protein [Acidobacteriota bacterium]